MLIVFSRMEVLVEISCFRGMLAQNPDYIVLRSERKRKEWKMETKYKQNFIQVEHFEGLLGGVLLKLLSRRRLNCFNGEMEFQHKKQRWILINRVFPMTELRIENSKFKGSFSYTMYGEEFIL